MPLRRVDADPVANSEGTVHSVFAIGPDTGGVGHVFEGSVQALSAAGYHVTVKHPDSGGSAMLAACRLVWSERQAVRRADVVHVEFGSNDHSSFWCALAVAAIRVAPVLIVHDPDQVAHAPGAAMIRSDSRWSSVVAYRILSPLLNRFLIRVALRSAAGLVVLGESGRAELQHRTDVPIQVVRHGAIRPTGDTVLPSLCRYVLFAGFLGPSKGLDVLIEAWGSQNVGTSELLIAGKGEHSEWLSDLESRSASQSNPVKWLGECDDEAFQRLIENAAIVVLPYRRSSPASGILVRAMSAGRCIVASGVPAVIENLRNGVEGLILPAEDVDALSDALGALLADPKRRDRLGEAARVRSEVAFGWDLLLSGLEEAYNRVRQ